MIKWYQLKKYKINKLKKKYKLLILIYKLINL